MTDPKTPQIDALTTDETRKIEQRVVSFAEDVEKLMRSHVATMMGSNFPPVCAYVYAACVLQHLHEYLHQAFTTTEEVGIDNSDNLSDRERAMLLVSFKTGMDAVEEAGCPLHELIHKHSHNMDTELKRLGIDFSKIVAAARKQAEVAPKNCTIH